MMQTSERCREAIKGFEGLTLTVKADCGQQEIGYGHDLLPGESYPEGIDEATAEELLTEDLAKVDAAMNAQHLALDLNQNQWDALADFTYECGKGALIQLLAHGVNQVPAQLPRWVHARVKGVETVVPGMVKRRATEVEWWNNSSQMTDDR